MARLRRKIVRAALRSRRMCLKVGASLSSNVSGILKGASWSRKKTYKVFFPPEEYEVIGEGGEDAGPPDDDDDDHNDDMDDWGVTPVEDDPQEREEDKILQALTRSNTDFNSVTANLMDNAPAPPPDPRKTRAQLQLGKPLTDSDGKKKTLLVSVMPFGGKNEEKAPHVTKVHTNDVPEKTTSKASSKSKDNGGVVLKSIVHTNGEFNVEPPKRATAQVPSDPKPVAAAAPAPEEEQRKPSLTNGFSGKSSLLNGKDTPTNSDKAPALPIKQKALEAAAAQMNSKHIFLKSIMDGGEDTAMQVEDAPPTTNGKDIYLSPVRAATRPEGKRTHITRGTPISKNNELLLKTKFNPLRTSAFLTKNNERNSELNDASVNQKKESSVIAAREVVLKVASSPDSSFDEEERPYSNVQVMSVTEKDSEEGAQTKRLSSLIAATLKAADRERDSPVGSRELAGEPDGRADPDSSSESGSEPPALPQSPPPAVDPRPSFLHGLSGLGTLTGIKPQVPFKSSSVMQAASSGSSILSPAIVSARWSQLEAQTKGAPTPAEPPQAPTSSPPSTPSSSPPSSPPSTPPGSSADAASRSHKRQAPKPPQVPSDEAVLLPPGRRGSLSPPPSPARDEPPKLPSSPSPSTPTLPSPLASSLYARNIQVSQPSAGKSQSPVTREKEKRFGHSSPPTRSESVPAALGQVALGQSVTLGAQSGHSIAQALAQALSQTQPQPQPSPRRALSMSTDSLSQSCGIPSGIPSGLPSGGKHVVSYDTERKKMGTKVRFSLRKFLGLHKEAGRDDGPLAGLGAPPEPAPRPTRRLEIIHPSDLSGTSVEVLRGSGVELRRQMQEAAEAANRRNSDVSSDSSGSSHPVIGSPTHSSGRPTKPPPPPRSQSLDSDRQETAGIGRPSRPPPPKTAELLRRQKQPPSPPVPPGHSVYANLELVPGEIRSGLAPLKPQRTGSVRDTTVDGPKRTPLPTETAANTSPTAAEKRVSESEDSRSADVASGKEPPKMPVRTCSLPSAAQPEDSGYESVELSDNAQPQSIGDEGETETSLPPSTTWKWRSRGRKGRSIVHKSMEDNYGAVVGANHEALAQLLEQDMKRTVFRQIRTGPTIPPPLRPLKAVSSLSWSDFSLDDSGAGSVVVAGRWTFLQALWGTQAVTLGVVPDQGSGAGLSGRGPFTLMPITEFCDLVPTSCLPSIKRHGSDHVQAWVGVLTRLRVDTLSSYGQVLSRQAAQAVQDGQTGSRTTADRDSPLSDQSGEDPREASLELQEAWREASLALLQLVNALKGLQAQGTEEASPESMVFLREPSGPTTTPQLAMLHSLHHGPEDNTGERSLCQCALSAVRALLPSAPTSHLLVDLLSKERAESLSRAKAVLEFWLWGPGDVTPAPSQKEREAALQRWLDLERATVLHRVVCARAAAGPNHRLAIPQQSHLLFLVHTSAKTMCDASQLLEAQSIHPLDTTNF